MRIALIPARGGSRRVPRKNIRSFHGRPMLSYPIETARRSRLFDLIAVSTDDLEIAGIAFQLGAVVVPRERDDGITGTQEIAARMLEALGVTEGLACVIYATTPLLDTKHLTMGRQALVARPGKCFAMSVGPDGQDAGCFYWGGAWAFRDRKPLDEANTVPVVLPAGRVCDINTSSDWQEAERKFIALRRAS